MTRNVLQYGSTTIARARNSTDLKRLLQDPWLKADPIIIKPNWVGTDPASFTDSETLRMLLETLDGRIIVTEAYQIGRSMHEPRDGLSFAVDGKEVNWRWLMEGGGWGWLLKNPSWDWFKTEGHWDHIRREDKRFLDEHGFTDLFNDHGAEYVNVTEEVWKGRNADPREIEEIVETRFPSILTEKLYGFIPQKLYEVKGATLISFAKVKHYATFTLKNIFGLIPDPIRAWWHGPKNMRFDTSVVDINKIYASLFNIYGICEALQKTAVKDPDGEFGVSTFRYNVAENLGVVAFGRHLVSLDAVLCGLLGFDYKDASYLKLAERVFGAYDRDHIKEAKKAVAEWFPSRTQ